MNNNKLRFALSIFILFMITPAIGKTEIKQGALTISPYSAGYLFEGNQPYGGGVLYGLNLGYNFSERLEIELSGAYANFEITKQNKLNYSKDKNNINGYVGNIDFLCHPFSKSSLVPYFLVGFGDLYFNDDKATNDHFPFVNYGAGFKFFITKSLAFRADARHIMTYDDSEQDIEPDKNYKINNNLYYTAGFMLQFGIGNDDSKDKLPPGTLLNIDGNPYDSDGDGVKEYADQCPSTPLGVVVDEKGCPFDNDKDGVYDYRDKCPGTPPGEQVNFYGCPRDQDKDGVNDEIDLCPDTAEGIPVNAKGCPEDQDEDGVYDFADECPNSPKGVKIDEKGCPVLEKKVVSIELNVQFDTNSYIIDAKYHSQIQQVADFLKTYPKTSATIEAHTDSVGKDLFNMKLSQKRAESVVRYLVEMFGIPAYRLNAVGHGETKPIADNRSVEGRQKNRRAVAVITTVTDVNAK